MAVRLQMKLGVVAEEERLQDSPDTIVVVEPTVGSTARSKGNLYLVATGPTGVGRALEATRLVAETIRDEYYYDESAGIVGCLEKVIRSANKRLTAQRERYGLGPQAANGPIGLGVAVVRGSELYVVTVGPVEAYLVRQARLLTLPDPHRERGLPSSDLGSEVWRGDITVGDTIVLVSASLTAKLGIDALKDALVTLHPQSAMEHLHHQYVALDGSGGDAALAVEATEVAATHRQRELVPVHPDEPLAGVPDRSPIPLADSVSGGVAAVQHSASRARTAAGGAAVGLLTRLQDVMPRRGPQHRRVTPASRRRESQRRAAIAVLVLVAVVAALGLGMFVFGGTAPSEQIPGLTASQRALAAAKEDVRLVFDNGANLVEDDPQEARQLLTDAYAQLGEADKGGVPASATDPLRVRVVAGLDTLFGVVPVGATQVFSFAAADPPVDIVQLIRGPDGAPFVLDRAGKAVYRIDTKEKKATLILRLGDALAGTKAGEPRLLAVGGPDLLILDSKSILWRWRAIDKKGNGTIARIRVAEASDWGKDIQAIGTFLRVPEQGLYNLYVVDPSAEQILRYSPAADGSGYPGASSGYLAAPQDVSDIHQLYIDGDVWAPEAGRVVRFVSGQRTDWEAANPGDELLRPRPDYSIVASPSGQGEGILYAYDAPNSRVIAVEKATGGFVAQYRLAAAPEDWASMRGMYVVPRPEGQSPVLYWVDANRLATSALQAVTVRASPAPGASLASPAPSGAPSAAATARPTRTPSATP